MKKDDFDFTFSFYFVKLGFRLSISSCTASCLQLELYISFGDNAVSTFSDTVMCICDIASLIKELQIQFQIK